MFFFSFIVHWRFPFDTKNPIGYLVGVVLQYNLLMYAAFIVACSASLGISSHLLVMLAIKDIKSILRSINELSKTKSDEQLNISKEFTEFIQMHSTMKQFSKFWSPFVSLGAFLMRSHLFQSCSTIFTNISTHFYGIICVGPCSNMCWNVSHSIENS